MFIKGNSIGDTGAKSLSDALKANTTLEKLNLFGRHKHEQRRLYLSEINSLFHQSTGNWIGETGATSLSDALKSNTTLIVLIMCSFHKRNNTQIASINNPLFSRSHKINREQDWRHRNNNIE